MPTRAKETADQYNQSRSDWRKNLQTLFAEKDKKRFAIKELFNDTPEKLKTENKLMRSKLNDAWKEKNADLIKKYQELYNQKILDEATFQKWLVEFKKLDPNLDEKTFRNLIMWETEEKISYTQLLNKPNMTAKDKEWMQKTIKFLEDNDMLTEENIKKLEAINYASNYIEIWWIKRAREDLKAQPKKKVIFQHGDTTYFKRSEDMLKEQNEILAEQWMEIPLDNYFESSLQALPWEYKERGTRYTWWNILSFITNMSMSGFCDSDGTLDSNGGYGFRWSASSRDDFNARYFKFSEDKGILHRGNRNNAFPVRPVLK